MFTPSKQLLGALATMAWPSVEQFEPGLNPRRPRKPGKPGQGGRALMEDVKDDGDDNELKEPMPLYDRGAGTITPGPNTGPAIQVSSAKVRAMSTDILASLNLI